MDEKLRAERRKAIDAVNSLMRQFAYYFNKIKSNAVIRELFPRTYEELVTSVRSTGIDREPTPISENTSVSILQELLQYYEKFNRDLIDDVRSEKHDHHGLHLILEKLIKALRWLIDYSE